jgi:dienelactone hydrolase
MHSRGSTTGIALPKTVLLLAAGLVAAAFMTTGARANSPHGGFGPEGPRMREQLWILPGADPRTPLRATVFRPEDRPTRVPFLDVAHRGVEDASRRRPLVVINHGSDASTREAVGMPVFYWLSRWFVERGYVVVLPQRRGHGATGGEFAEGRDSCARPDHYQAGQTAADDIEAAVRFMAGQSFVDPDYIIVAGTSTGGWASLAIAGRSIPGLRLVVNFSGGRGGHAYGRPHAVCHEEGLIAAAGRFAREAKVPTAWFYTRNDSYFGPDLATAMARRWSESGGSVDLRVLPSFGPDGHELVADRGSWPLWTTPLEQHLTLAAGRAIHRERLEAQAEVVQNGGSALGGGRR